VDVANSGTVVTQNIGRIDVKVRRDSFIQTVHATCRSTLFFVQLRGRCAPIQLCQPE
jgi:hypothetical protein